MDRPHPPFCRLQGSRERLCWPLLGPTGRPRWALMMPSASPAFSPFSVRVVGGFLARTRNGATEANPIFISEYTPSPISTWKLLSIFTNNSRLCESMPDYRSKSIREPKRGSPIFTRLCTWTTYRYFLLFIGNYSRLDSENGSSIWHWANVLSEMETRMNEFRVWERGIWLWSQTFLCLSKRQY